MDISASGPQRLAEKDFLSRVKELHGEHSFTGLLLLTSGAVVVTGFGGFIQDINKIEEARELERTFLSEYDSKAALIYRGTAHHVVYRTGSSCYAITKQRKSGIALGRTAFGTILATFEHSTPLQQVVCTFECLCDSARP